MRLVRAGLVASDQFGLWQLSGMGEAKRPMVATSWLIAVLVVAILLLVWFFWPSADEQVGDDDQVPVGVFLIAV